jgi:hypothetical protein
MDVNISELTVDAISPEQVKRIFRLSGYGDSVSFDDKQRVLDLLSYYRGSHQRQDE